MIASLLPDQIVNRFRTVSLERLARLEAAWSALVRAPDDVDTARVLHRETHTLKGDSRVVGFTDVNLVCHKLEDLLDIARTRRYRVGDDVRDAVTTAIRFAGTLMNKRAGEPGDIDLPELVKQIDAVVADARRERLAAASEPPVYGRAPVERREEAPPGIRASLSRAAVDVFVESAVGNVRLGAAWIALRDAIRHPPRESIAPQLARHQEAARVVARALGKQVVVRFDIADATAPPDVAALLDATTLDLLRNTIDHGIERPGARIHAGKPGIATVGVSLAVDGDHLVLVVQDDGHGIDFDRIRTKGLSMGLLDPSSASRATPHQLGCLLFRPGFSTRVIATDISGRGVRLDTIAASVAGAGGSIDVDAELGRGTTWTVRLPNPPASFPATIFHSLADVPIAVAADWTAERISPSSDAVDPLVALGVAPLPIPRDVITLRLTRRDTSLVVLAREPVLGGSAAPILAFPDDAPATVAMIDGVEGLLVRPELLARR
jgi:two-component system chemotaxis sensor kinase CheA